MMKFPALLLSILFVLLVLPANQEIRAESRNEIAFSIGAGSLQVNPGGGIAPVWSFSYLCHITRHFSAEGAVDVFYYKFLSGPLDDQTIYKDDYLGAEAALLYYFLPNQETHRLLPYVVAGIGKTSTDFSEIPGHPYYRFGAGLSYNVTGKWGLRLEVREEIIKSLYIYGNPTGNLASARLGIFRRF